MHKMHPHILAFFLLPLVVRADHSDEKNQDTHTSSDAQAKGKQGSDLFLTADFIYWTARQEGLEFATSGFSMSGNTTRQGTAPFPNFGYHPGLKAGIGANVGHDRWDVYANYTWLDTGKRHASLTTTGDLWLLWETIANDFASFTVLSGNATWKLNFNVVDLELGRNFYLNPYLVLRPYFGLKGSWQQQHFTTHFIDASAKKYAQHFHQSYRGIGIRGGFDSSWQFSKNWGIYGDLALSGMWSRFNDTRKDEETIASIASVFINTKALMSTITPVLELGLGLKWDCWFSNESYHFGIKSGWELQTWWSMNRFIGTRDQGPHGNLNTQGLTVEARFDF